MTARIEGIYITLKKAEDLESVPRVRAVAGRGLEGDRYGFRAGTFSAKDGATPKPGRQLTLIESEAIERLSRESRIQLAPGQSRRNLVTRGVALNDLVGKRFRIGTVECRGVQKCDPCGHLEKLTVRGVKDGLHDAGGLRADILTDGEISVGDALVVLEVPEMEQPLTSPSAIRS